MHPKRPHRTTILTAFLFLFALGGTLPLAAGEPPPKPASEATRPIHRGVNWVAWKDPVTEKDLRPLVDHHVGWIAQTPFGWQRRFDSPNVKLVTGGRVLWGETDKGLSQTHRAARKLGIQTLLKPHIWLTDRSDGKWRTDIRMNSEEEWQEWFESYSTFILHYARLAEKEGMAALAIGTELHGTVVEREKDWRRLIAEIRKVYNGQLTYSANWWREFEEVPFWDALDYIGIQGYFPLTDQEKPTLDQLLQGWQSHKKAILAVSQRFEKPVVFTEVGYRNTADAAIRPWEWPEPPKPPLRAPETDVETQQLCFEAFFQTFWEEPWFRGVYFWKWFPYEPSRSGLDFTPQGRPAAQVMARWFQRKSPR